MDHEFHNFGRGINRYRNHIMRLVFLKYINNGREEDFLRFNIFINGHIDESQGQNPRHRDHEFHNLGKELHNRQNHVFFLLSTT